MNKKLLIASFAVLACLAGKETKAFYAGLSVGATDTKVDGNKIGTGTSYTAAIGTSIPLLITSIRAEAEYMSLVSSGEKDGGNLDRATTSGYGLNAYLDLPLLPLIKPYIGFGLAHMKQEIRDLAGDKYKSKSDLTPQYMIGLDASIPLLPIAGGIEWRYIDTKFDYDGKVKSSISSFLVKARVYF